MGTSIQVRDVRPDVHAELVRRAAVRGISLSAYVEQILEREVARLDMQEWVELVKAREPMPVNRALIVELVREQREELEERWERLWPTPPRSQPSSSKPRPRRRSTRT